MTITEGTLNGLDTVIAAAPVGPYLPDGTPGSPYGLRYKANGGWITVGGDGSIHPSLVNLILASAEQMPILVSECRRLITENTRLRKQLSNSKGKTYND